MLALVAWLVAYGPTKTEPESVWNVVVGVVAILVFAGLLLGFRARGRRMAKRQSTRD
jgi:hypothetical protein